jgi:single-stranded-DNA-specific exonuclease
VEAEIEEECLRLLAAEDMGASVVISSEGWHPGVIGIVASRLAEKFWRPAIVLAEENGLWRGSARGIKGLHLFEALCACSHLLERFGGHRQAGGMLVSDGNLKQFRAAFKAYCASHLSATDLIPALELDLPLPLERVSLRLVEELGLLEPYGVGNPRPVFAASAVRPLRWGCMRERHLRASFGRGRGRIEAVGFGLWMEEPAGGLDIAFGPELNDWRGARSVRLNIKAIRPAEPTGPPGSGP